MKILLNASPATNICPSDHNTVAPKDCTFELKFF